MSNVVQIPTGHNRVHASRFPTDSKNRLRRARYETKKQALTVSPRTVFRLEVIRFF